MPIKQRLELKQEPVFLMDGSAYVFRSFYANQNMARSDGMPTNVLYMVLRMLFKIVREENPAYFAFILDGRGKNFRHRLYPEYKANRSATPEPLAVQFAPLNEAICNMGLTCIVSDDCEADDCIASLAQRFGAERPVIILGADKDLKQCLSPNVSIWDPSAKEERITTLENFMEQEGFSPQYWPDYQAIVGDSSDNIPGVPGIGPKGANTLMREFKGLEDIFGRMAAVPPALRKKLDGQQEKAMLSRTLTTLQKDTCEDVTLESLAPEAPKQKELMEFLNTYELRTLARELSSMLRISSAAQPDNASGGLTLGAGFKTSFSVKPKPADATASAMPAPESQTSAPATARLSFSSLEQASLLEQPVAPSADFSKVPVLQNADGLPDSQAFAIIPIRDITRDKAEDRLLIGDGRQEFICTLPSGGSLALTPGLAKLLAGKKLIAPGIKQVFELYPELRQIPLENCFDLSLAAWMLSPEEYDYTFSKLLRRWGPEAGALLEQDGLETQKNSSIALGMQKVMSERLHAQQLDEVLRALEMPLVPVLLDMQDAGIGIDKEAFRRFLEDSQARLDDLTSKIYEAAGQEFNIRSARQLGDILYEKLALPKARKTAGGQASTAQASLEKLLGKHPIIEPILEYRKLEKLRSTYLEPLPRLADANNRLHTSFNQSSTATGRLSSSNPNLQNIPVRGPLGGLMRACFTAAPGNLLVSADYSQIELRVLAHLSQDPTLLDAFRKGEDIHSRTAALIFDVAGADVTPDQRRNAKTINFGLIYGMGPQKLAQDLGINMKEAKAFIDKYFEKLGKLREYFDSIEQSAKDNGYVCTMTGRRRYIPEIYSANQQLRSQARRQAINTCIQGSAADIIKMAMLAASRDEELKRLGATLILQIHDELLLECPEKNAAAAGKRLADIMAEVTPGGEALSVPLLTDYGQGKSWADAH